MPGIQGCNRVSEDAFGRLEPCAVKVARTVLRGLGAGNRVWLPGIMDAKRATQSEPFVGQTRLGCCESASY
jgi:hypothetical protein